VHRAWGNCGARVINGTAVTALFDTSPVPQVIPEGTGLRQGLGDLRLGCQARPAQRKRSPYRRGVRLGEDSIAERLIVDKTLSLKTPSFPAHTGALAHPDW
jgi:hypothetical protein